VSEVRIVWDGARLAELLRSPAGPVGRHIIGRGEIVRQAGKAKANRDTGCLQDSIVKRIEEGPEGIKVRIVADTTPCSPSRTSYALFVHEGTEAHQIVAKNAQALSFEWHGQRVFFASVNHPGYKGNPFLRDALPLAVA
jgi:hypothetical protein